MRPTLLLYGGALFLAGLPPHVLLWRWRHPRRHAPTLLAVLFALCVTFTAAASRIDPTLQPAEVAAVLLLCATLACCYIQAYPAFQGFDPSLVIMLLLEHAPGGLTEELRFSLDDRLMLDERLQDVLKSGLGLERDGLLELAPSGATPFVREPWSSTTLGRC